MDRESLLFARYPALYKAKVDDARMSVTAVLSYPVVDLAHDYINPSGGIYKSYEKRPWCGLEHYRLKKGTRNEVVYPDDAEAGPPVVAGWLRQSLSEPGAPCSIKHRKFVVKGKEYALPTAEIFYDPDSRFSSQVFAMVKADALPGVSLELAAPDGYEPTVLKARSPLEPHRPAWKFDKWEMCGVVNCAKPVNPGALVAKSVHDDALATILNRRQIVTGNGTTEELHPLILKAFADKAPGKSATVVSGFRAEKAMYDEAMHMGDDEGAEPSVYDDAHEEAAGEEQGTPTVKVAYQLAQDLMDAVSRAREGLEGSEHKGGKKAILAICDQLEEKYASKAIAMGDKVRSDVSIDDVNANEEADELDDESEGEDGEAEEGEEEGDSDNFEDKEDPEVEEDATESDEEDKEKRIKALRHPDRAIYKSVVHSFRMSAQQIADAPEIDIPTVEDDPDNSPEEQARLAKARLRMKKLLRQG